MGSPKKNVPCQHVRRGSENSLWLVRAFRSNRQSDVEHVEPATAGVAPGVSALIPDLDRARHFEA
jgi:hypothetical protein